jgi:hypothetical protein
MSGIAGGTTKTYAWATGFYQMNRRFPGFSAKDKNGADSMLDAEIVRGDDITIKLSVIELSHAMARSHNKLSKPLFFMALDLLLGTALLIVGAKVKSNGVAAAGALIVCGALVLRDRMLLGKEYLDMLAIVVVTVAVGFLVSVLH